MEQAQEPGHAATEGVEPDHPATGTDRPRRANRSLRVRMIGAVLIAGVATVAVGSFGINRMSALSAAADVVHTEGTVPVDALRKLQVDWWELQTHIARANIEALPAASRASSQEKATATGQTLAADVEAAADLALSPDAKAAFGEFAGSTQQYLALVAQIQQIVTDAQTKAAAAAAQLASGPPLSPAAQRAVAEQQAAGQARVLAAMQPLIAQMNELEVTIVDSATAATAAASAAASDAAAEARDAYEAARTLTLITIAVAVVLSLAIGLIVARSVRGPVQRMRDLLGQVADGDLTVRAGTVGGGAELGEMAASLDTTLDASRTSSAWSTTPPGGWRARRRSSTGRPTRWRRTPAPRPRRPRRSSPPPARSPPAWTPWPPGPPRWSRPSARSRTTPPRRPAWPVRRSRSRRRRPARSASSVTRRRRSPR